MKCPKCGEWMELKETSVGHVIKYSYFYYKCPDCEYCEIAKKDEKKESHHDTHTHELR